MSDQSPYLNDEPKGSPVITENSVIVEEHFETSKNDEKKDS